MWRLAILAFSAIIREGIETSLFLVGQVTAVREEPGGNAFAVLLGALTGLVIAAGLGYGFYRGSRRLNLATFFRWTGIVLVFLAAGLLGGAVHEFSEINVIPFGGQIAFDISNVLPHETGIGQFLAALFGYTSQPEVTRLIAQAAYLVIVLALYLRPVTRTTLDSTPTPVTARG